MQCLFPGSHCPVAGQVFQSCGSPCNATCSDPFPLCIGVCQPGCGCPSGHVIDERKNRCVHSCPGESVMTTKPLNYGNITNKHFMYSPESNGSHFRGKHIIGILQHSFWVKSHSFSRRDSITSLSKVSKTVFTLHCSYMVWCYDRKLNLSKLNINNGLMWKSVDVCQQLQAVSIFQISDQPSFVCRIFEPI